MAVIKCKMCGGDLDISEGLSVCECEYCGTKQTVPSADDEKKLTLFARANRLRLANEFDKASSVYESIVADFPEEAEAYWGLVLCKYGIEYVDDPATGKKIPTCHRSSFDSVLDDTDFDQACENADAIARRQYREEAKQIEDIRRGIIEISGREEPYDIFICYKESDDSGDRTVDSVIAQDVYDALTAKGYRVFFSRISLEDKLGSEYEPYIFAALNSAKVMLAFGTDYEYYNAVWVKNEWSRFLKQMEKDKSMHLIPCYKNLDPYDMPKEFQRLQGQDMGKVGAVQDLLRGIEKILPREQNAAQPAAQAIQQVVQSGGPNAAALYDRGYMALEDGEWDKAKDYFDQVLNMDSRFPDAYLGLALAKQHLHGEESISVLDEYSKIDALTADINYHRFARFASEERSATIENFISHARADIAEKKRQEEEKKRLAEEKRRLEEARIAEEKRRREEKRRQYLEQKKLELAPIRNRLKTAQGIIAAGGTHNIGLRSNGMVLAAGDNSDDQCNINGWSDVFSVTVGYTHTVGLKVNGTVFAVGNNLYGQCDVDDWNDISAVAAGNRHTVGLKTNGTVVAAGCNANGQCDINDWRGIVAIAAGGNHTVGLKASGTVVAVGANTNGECNVRAWSEIVAVAAGGNHTIGLRSDGTVVATGENGNGRCDVSDWDDIVAVTGGGFHTVGLKSDGTMVATGGNSSGQCNISEWREIVAISAGGYHTLGLKADGTVVVTRNDTSECDVSNWKLFNSLDSFAKERQEAVARAEAERREAAARVKAERREAASRAEAERQKRVKDLTAEQGALRAELANLKGLFSGKRRREIEARLAQIEKDLGELEQ